MDMGAAMTWWLLAGLLVACEVATGTFYLLMLAVGAAVGALAAHADAGTNLQIVAAAAVAAGTTAAWHLVQRRGQRLPPEANPDVNPDIGAAVHVDAWQPDGTARVQYRGAAWSVRFAGNGTPVPGAHRVVAVHGSQLQVSPDVQR